jgi:hypothetical protein
MKVIKKGYWSTKINQEISQDDLKKKNNKKFTCPESTECIGGSMIQLTFINDVGKSNKTLSEDFESDVIKGR